MLNNKKDRNRLETFTVTCIQPIGWMAGGEDTRDDDKYESTIIEMKTEILWKRGTYEQTSNDYV